MINLMFSRRVPDFDIDHAQFFYLHCLTSFNQQIDAMFVITYQIQ